MPLPIGVPTTANFSHKLKENVPEVELTSKAMMEEFSLVSDTTKNLSLKEVRDRLINAHLKFYTRRNSSGLLHLEVPDIYSLFRTPSIQTSGFGKNLIVKLSNSKEFYFFNSK